MQITPTFTAVEDTLRNLRMAEHVINFVETNGAKDVAGSALSYVNQAATSLTHANQADVDARQAAQLLGTAQQQLTNLAWTKAMPNDPAVATMLADSRAALRDADAGVAALYTSVGGNPVEFGYPA